MTNILIIDDDHQLLRALRVAFTARGYDVTLATDATSAIAAASSRTPDLAIVDLGLPDMDGLTVIERIRNWSGLPIIVLSARHLEEAKINALDVGADDYLTKPFGTGELLARVRAALRRATPTDEQPVITTAAFTIDLAARTITTAQGQIRLTLTEWQLLEILVRNPDTLITQQKLLHDVWGPRYEAKTNYLRVHLANLRRKLEPDPTRPRYLHTEPNLGYRFTPEPTN
jgi:two-component system, OmpR family, KDP operon response regulator KdpE